MSNQATERMLQYVEAARQRAKRAEREFDRRNSDIQWKASSSIDLFGGTATSRVVEIASDARRACDDLYSAYQMGIQTLDEQCRPLLDGKPESRAVREVRDLIKWLNDESEIENNFSASLNSTSLGQVASAKYVPTMECRMIQRYWENKYENMPERLEEQRLQRERAEQARRQAEDRAQQEFDRKMVEYEKQMAEYEKKLPAYQKEMEIYNGAYKRWQAEVAAIEKMRKTRVNNRIESEKTHRRRSVEKKFREQQEDLTVEKRSVQMLLNDTQRRFEGTGLLRIAERKMLKDQILQLTQKVNALDESIRAVPNRMQDALRSEERSIESKREQYMKEDAVHNPNPPAPRKPQELVQPTKPVKQTARSAASSYSGGGSVYDRPTPTQLVNESMMQAILDGMEYGRLYSITDLIMEIPELADMTNQRTSALVRQLWNRGDLERIEEKRKAYFRRV